MRSLTLGCSSKPPSILPQPTHPLETVCILLLDLVVALAKFLLVFIFSLEETPVRASFLSQQPSLRAFTRCLFITSFLGQSRPSFSLVGLENPFLTPPLCTLNDEDGHLSIVPPMFGLSSHLVCMKSGT